jgi:hypothetical protein
VKVKFASASNSVVVEPIVVNSLAVALLIAVTVPPPIYVLNLDARQDFSVPPAPSSIINRSASTMAAPISVAPSISNAPISTLPAVEIVASLLSAIAAEEFTSALTITPEPIAAVPLEIVTSPDIPA